MKKHLLGALVALAALSGCAHRQSCCGPLAAPPLPLPDAPEAVHQRVHGEFSGAVVDTVHFATDKSYLTDDAKDILWRQSQWLLANQDVDVVIDGHADKRASDGYNYALGMRRAEAVREYLVKAGVDESRVSVASEGESRPVAEGSDSVSLSLNRRAVTRPR
jgi:peptidoglycan-associated lipoprotein